MVTHGDYMAGVRNHIILHDDVIMLSSLVGKGNSKGVQSDSKG